MKIFKFKKSALSLGLCTVLCAGAAGCGTDSKDAKGDGMTPAAREHAAMRASLRDSAALYRQRAEELQPQIEALQAEFDSLSGILELDARPEYVEHYRVAKGWKGYDTMAGTGILARLLENGDIEVVASSASGSFTSVTLSSGGESATTQSVAEGSGLNYTVGNVTRVTFIGADASALCGFAAAHKGSPLKLTYNGAKTSSVTLTSRQADMLAFIGEIVEVKNRLDQLDKSYIVAFNKQTLYENEVRKDSVAATEKNKQKN